MLKHLWARIAVGRTAVSDPLGEDDRPDARFELEWRGVVRARLVVMLAGLGLWALGAEAWLIHLQVYSHGEFVAKARAQQIEIIEEEAPRGDIADRNGQLLAYSVESFDIVANPSQVKDPVAETAALCAALGDCSAADRAQILARLKRKSQWVVVRAARDVSPTAVLQVEALIAARAQARENPIYSLETRSRRYYPKLDLAAQVIGFVGADGKGGAGIESKWDRTIRGTNGRTRLLIDAKLDDVLRHVESAPQPGASLDLTLDVRLQHVAERELRAGLLAANALSGTAIVMASRTGEVLAMANYPPFNPNLYGQSSADQRRNRAVEDQYEPGSTMKIVTIAAALNEGLYRSSDAIDTRPGIFTLPGRVIREDKGHNYGVLSFEDVLVRSSNVGSAMIGLHMGADRLVRYVEGFGFGRRLTADLPGESRGQVWSAAQLDESGLASVAMGYQVGVTPIQLTTAFNVIATGGLLLEPRVVRAVTSRGRRHELAPKVLGRVVSADTANAVTAMLEGVVERGTGKPAGLTRYQVAGKTGTASKIVNGRYSKTDYNVSFGGFVPSRRPEFTILVVVDTPREGPAYGSTVAAPIFRRIAEAALQLSGVAPSFDPAPPIVTAGDRSAPRPAPRPVSEPAVIKAAGSDGMPDLTGLALRDALRVTTALGLTMTVQGDGVVVGQQPEAGAAVVSGSRGALQLRRAPAKPGEGGR